MRLTKPGTLVSIERSLVGGVLRTLFGFGLSYADVHDYTGTRADAVGAAKEDVTAPAARTRLREDCDAARIVGCAGGWDNYVRVGLAFDTRDFEPDPNSGVFADLAADFGTRGLASEYDYTRVMLAARGYWSPAPRLADVVLAVRGVVEVQSQGTPFTSLNTFPFTEDVRTGMGGVRTLRGYRDNRFVGHVMALTNAEIRWTFARTRVFGENLGFMAAPFVDLGRVFDSARRATLGGFARAQGLGLRVAWNLATIITFDYGFSDEDSGFYINLNQIF